MSGILNIRDPNTGKFTPVTAIAGVGVPAKGTTGQILTKISDADYDTQWKENDASKLGGKAPEEYATAEEVGQLKSDKLDKTATAADSSKLGGKAPEYYLQPRNLLDNSDFTNPVNQRNAGTVVNDYVVDRWCGFKTTDGSVSITPDGITATGDGYLQHRLPSGTLKSGVVYTIAVYYSDGSIDVNTNGEYAIMDQFDIVNYIKPNGKTIAHVALYEGTYTADTLPPYVPKGYAQELSECDLYYRPLGDNVMSVIGMTSSDGGIILLKSIRPMREGGVPTIVNNGTLYARVNGTDYTVTQVRIHKSDKSGVEIFATASGSPSKQAATIHGSDLLALSRDL